MRVSCGAIDEIAVEGELPNERVDLAQRERRADGARDSDGRSDRSGRRGRGPPWPRPRRRARPCFLGEREDAEDAPDAGRPFVVVDVLADLPMPGPAVCARASSASVVFGVRAGRSRSSMRCQPAARAEVLAQEAARRRVEEPDVQVVPLHLHVAANPAGRRAVVRRLDFDAAVEVAPCASP